MATGLLLTGCARPAQPASEPAQPARERLSWLVCIDGTPQTEDFFAENRIGCQLATCMGEEPLVLYSAQDAVTEISLRIASGTLPDLVTVETRDEANRLCSKDAYTYDLSDLLLQVKDMLPATSYELVLKRGRGHGIPGGFSKSSSDQARFGEGIYVRSKHLDETQVYDPAAFCQLLAAVISEQKQFLPVEKESLYPILFEGVASPYETLEHTFGIPPLYYHDGKIGHRIFEENWASLLAFLRQIRQASDCTALWSPETLLDALLDDRVQMYIGRHDPVAAANLTLEPQERFVPIWPSFSVDGFLQVYSRQGQYMTFVCNNGRDSYERAVRCLEALLTEQAGQIATMGEPNRDWICDGNGKPVFLHGQQTEEQNLEQGILQFPFLSTIGLGNKGYEAPLTPFDALEVSYSQRIYPSEADSIYLWSFEQKIKDLIEDTLTDHALDEQTCEQRLDELRLSEELMHLEMGIP